MMADRNLPEASDIVFYVTSRLEPDNKARNHRHRARVGGDVSRWWVKMPCRRRWSVSTGKRTRLNNWFSSAHDLIAFPRSDGSAILRAAGSYGVLANGSGYDVLAGTRQHKMSRTAKSMSGHHPICPTELSLTEAPTRVAAEVEQ